VTTTSKSAEGLFIVRKRSYSYDRARAHLAESAEAEKAICGRALPRFRTAKAASTEEVESLRRTYAICQGCRKKLTGPESAPKLSEEAMEALYRRALAAADAAWEAAVPRPMIVGTPKNMMASLMGQDGGGLDPEKPIYYESEGACGFAWVIVRPGTSRFARFLKAKGYGQYDDYRGGVSIWSPGGERMSQSYARKIAAAHAFAEVLREAGIKAYGDGRLD
jgi:hypothetical protein